MELVIRFLLTLSVAWIGGAIGEKIHLPSPWLVGGLCSVTVFNAFTGMAYFPAYLRILIMICSGSMLGIRINRDNLKDLKKLPQLLLISTVVLIVLTMVFGTGMHLLSGIDLKTALYAVTPGGMTDMTLIAMEQGADSGVVIVLHLVRYITSITLLPICIRPVVNRYANASSKEESGTAATAGEPLSLRRVLLTLAAAAVGGTIGYISGIPSGVLAFALAGAAIYNVATGQGQLPKSTSKYVTFFAGAYIGTGIDTSSLTQVGSLITAVILMVLTVLAWSFAVAWLINKLSHLNMATCIMACSPGGMQEMSLMAMEYKGVDIGVVAIMQLYRILVAVSIIPSCVSLLTNITG